MIGLKIAGYAGGAALVAGTYFRHTSHGYKAFGPGAAGDVSMLDDRSTSFKLFSGAFGGENLFLNLGAAIGGPMIAGGMESRYTLQALRDQAMGSAGYARSSGVYTKADEPGHETITRRPAKKYARNWGRGWKADIYRNRMGGGSVIPGKEGAYLDSLFVGPGGAGADPFGRPDAAMRNLQENTKGMSPKQRLRSLGVTDKGSSVYKGVVNAGRVRRVAKLATWAPLAYLGFSMLDALSNMPAPNHPNTPRRSASLSGTFMDTGVAMTQRRRALEAMHNSQYSGRAALGNESSIVHS